jgi:hypothetical protein
VTPDELRKVAARVVNSTAGTWSLKQDIQWPFSLAIKAGQEFILNQDLSTYSTEDKCLDDANAREENLQQRADLEFIVAAHRDIPALLAHIREQERVIEGLRADKERLDWLIENRASLWNSQYKDRAAIDAVRGGPNA